MPGSAERFAVWTPSRIVVCVVFAAAVVWGASLLAGCSSSSQTTGPGKVNESPAKVAATETPKVAVKPVEADTGAGIASPPIATTRTKMGLLIWVPADWLVVTDTSTMLSIVPKAYKDTWGKAGAGVGLVGVQVLKNPKADAKPADGYEIDSQGADTISPAQETTWLGLKGLRWTMSSGDMHLTVTDVGGGGKVKFKSMFQVLEPADVDKYQAAANGILEAMNRVK